eukprot:6212304-Pleurochrysis_carterae.AAC.5
MSPAADRAGFAFSSNRIAFVYAICAADRALPVASNVACPVADLPMQKALSTYAVRSKSTLVFIKDTPHLPRLPLLLKRPQRDGSTAEPSSDESVEY